MHKSIDLKTKTPQIRGAILSIQISILERNKEITLAGYIMFINRTRFINTISRHLKFMTAEHIVNTYSTTLKDSISQVKHIYMKQGFKITNILENRQLVCIRGNLAELQININVCSNYDHMGNLEQLN